MRRRASTANLFSQQNEERRVQVAWHTGKESVKVTLLPRLINIVVVRRQEDVGLLRTDRLGAQVFVFLAKDKGDSLRVTP